MINQFAPKCLLGFYLVHGKLERKPAVAITSWSASSNALSFGLKFMVSELVSLCITTEYILRSCSVPRAVNDIIEVEENI